MNEMKKEEKTSSGSKCNNHYLEFRLYYNWYRSDTCICKCKASKKHKRKIEELLNKTQKEKQKKKIKVPIQNQKNNKKK